MNALLQNDYKYTNDLLYWLMMPQRYNYKMWGAVVQKTGTRLQVHSGSLCLLCTCCVLMKCKCISICNRKKTQCDLEWRACPVHTQEETAAFAAIWSLMDTLRPMSYSLNTVFKVKIHYTKKYICIYIIQNKFYKCSLKAIQYIFSKDTEI